jgi:transposase-like protein
LANADVASAATPASSAATAKAPGTSHQLGKWLSAHRLQIRRAVLAVSSKSIGISRQALAGDLRSGQSLADIAAAHGTTAQSVVTALVKAADTRIDNAVTHHKLTTAQATKIKTKLSPFVVKLVNHHFQKKAGPVAPSKKT